MFSSPFGPAGATAKQTPTTSAGGLRNFMNQMSFSRILMILAVLLIVGVAGYFIYMYFQAQKKVSYKPNNEKMPAGSSNETNVAEMMLFYVDWCPHCKTAKPAWEEVKADYENKTINGYRVIFTEINCTNESPEIEQLMNKYNIEGFPTIKLVKDGQVIEYDAKPTKATMEQFLNTVL
jgi:thiol-disulfide isomerase/thioredoxin